MKKNTKKALYESIMKSVAYTVKKSLNEAERDVEFDSYGDDDDDIDEIEVWVDSLNQSCLVTKVFDADTSEEFYQVCDEDGEYVCEIHEEIDFNDEESIAELIEDNLDWETGSGRYEDVGPLRYSGRDDEECDEGFAYEITLQNGDVIYESEEDDEIFDTYEDAEAAANDYVEDLVWDQEDDEDGFTEADYRVKVYKI